MQSSRERGSILLVALGLIVLLGVINTTNSLMSGIQNRAILRRLSKMEGVFSSEITAWLSYSTSQNGVTSIPRTIASIDSAYADSVAGSADPYSPAQYFPGHPLNVIASRVMVGGASQILRRYDGTNLQYAVNTHNYCGYSTQGNQSYGSCLVPVNGPSGNVPLSCSQVSSNWFVGSTGDCSLDPVVNQQYISMRTRPFNSIRTLSDFQTIQSNANYKLEADLNIPDGFVPLKIKNTLIDGNGHTLKTAIHSSFGTAAVFLVLQDGALFNLQEISNGPLDIPLIGTLTGKSCVYHVGKKSNLTNLAPLVWLAGTMTTDLGDTWGNFLPPQPMNEHFVIANSWIETSAPSAMAQWAGLLFQAVEGQAILYQVSACANLSQGSSPYTAGGLLQSNMAPVVIQNSFFVGKIAAVTDVGGLVGGANAPLTIMQSGFQGTIMGLSAAGLLSRSSNVSNTITIDRCFVKGTINAATAIALGNIGNGVIKRSFFDGSLEGNSVLAIGGSTGNASITDSYSKGTAKLYYLGVPANGQQQGSWGNYTSSGPVIPPQFALVESPPASNLSLNNTYSSFTITIMQPTKGVDGSPSIYGTSGQNLPLSASSGNNFWDLSSGATQGVAGAGEPASWFSNQSNFPSSWDFTNTWQMAGAYPTLR